MLFSVTPLNREVIFILPFWYNFFDFSERWCGYILVHTLCCQFLRVLPAVSASKCHNLQEIRHIQPLSISDRVILHLTSISIFFVISYALSGSCNFLPCYQEYLHLWEHFQYLLQGHISWDWVLLGSTRVSFALFWHAYIMPVLWGRRQIWDFQLLFLVGPWFCIQPFLSALLIIQNRPTHQLAHRDLQKQPQALSQTPFDFLCQFSKINIDI